MPELPQACWGQHTGLLCFCFTVAQQRALQDNKSTTTQRQASSKLWLQKLKNRYFQFILQALTNLSINWNLKTTLLRYVPCVLCIYGAFNVIKQHNRMQENLCIGISVNLRAKKNHSIHLFLPLWVVCVHLDSLFMSGYEWGFCDHGKVAYLWPCMPA